MPLATSGASLIGVRVRVHVLLQRQLRVGRDQRGKTAIGGDQGRQMRIRTDAPAPAAVHVAADQSRHGARVGMTGGAHRAKTGRSGGGARHEGPAAVLVVHGVAVGRRGPHGAAAAVPLQHVRRQPPAVQQMTVVEGIDATTAAAAAAAATGEVRVAATATAGTHAHTARRSERHTRVLAVLLLLRVVLVLLLLLQSLLLLLQLSLHLHVLLLHLLQLLQLLLLNLQLLLLVLLLVVRVGMLLLLLLRMVLRL